MSLNIKLNGSNYVSEKTQRSYQKALEDGHQVHLAGNNGGNGKISPSVDEASHSEQMVPSRVLSTLESDFSQIYEHQKMTVQTHSRFLDYQAEYAGIFSQLMQQQSDIFSNGNGGHQQAQNMAQVLETLSQSMAQFHDIQSKALDTHTQFLSQQGQYSHMHVQLLTQNQTPTLASPAPQRSRPPVPHISTPPAPQPPNSSAPQPPSSPAPQPPSSQMPTLEELTTSLLEIVSDKTGYPTEMLELDMDMEADLGIDSIKRVEIMGALQEQYPDLPDVEAETLGEMRTLAQIADFMGNLNAPSAPHSPSSPAPQPPISPAPHSLSSQIPTLEELTTSLLEIVSDKTGYPAEMLELDMDMEADLGIDSIKRVEIMGTLQEQYPDLPDVEAEALGEMRTLAQIADFMGNLDAPPAPHSPSSRPPSSVPRPPSSVPPPPSPVSPPSLITRQDIALRELPNPDYLEFDFPEDHLWVVSEDGTQASLQVVNDLRDKQWPVLLLSFPSELVEAAPERAFPDDLPHIVLDKASPDYLGQEIDKIQAEHGPIGGFIHMHPAFQGQGLFPEAEEMLTKAVFFTAKHLTPTLTSAAKKGRSTFMTVTRLDGKLGLNSSDHGAIGGGLFGLTKTLSLEWPHVFCRALDLSPDLNAQQSAAAILDELHDPNQLVVEVGRTSDSRVTLEAK